MWVKARFTAVHFPALPPPLIGGNVGGGVDMACAALLHFGSSLHGSLCRASAQLVVVIHMGSARQLPNAIIASMAIN